MTKFKVGDRVRALGKEWNAYVMQGNFYGLIRSDWIGSSNNFQIAFCQEKDMQPIEPEKPSITTQELEIKLNLLSDRVERLEKLQQQNRRSE